MKTVVSVERKIGFHTRKHVPRGTCVSDRASGCCNKEDKRGSVYIMLETFESWFAVKQ